MIIIVFWYNILLYSPDNPFFISFIKKNLIDFQRSSYVDSFSGSHDVVDCGLSKGPSVEVYKKNNIHVDLRGDVYLGHYTPSELELRLKDEIRKRYGLTDHQKVFIGAGSFGLIEKIAHKFTVDGSFLGFFPQFNEVPSEFECSGFFLNFSFWMKDNQIKDNYIEDFLSSAHLFKPKVIYIDNPNNPTGFLFPKKDIQKISDYCEMNDILLIIDETLGDYVEDYNSATNIVASNKNTIVIRSFSKGFGLAAYRVGYMIVNSEISSFFDKIVPPFQTSAHSLELAIAVHQKRDILLPQIRIDISNFKKQLISYLQKKQIYTCPTNDSVPILTCYSKKIIDLQKELLNVGILTESLSLFSDLINLSYDNYTRIAIPFLEKEQNELLHRINGL